MAKIRMSVPFIIRELVSEVSQLLTRNFGVPMHAEVDEPSESEVKVAGKAKLHFEKAVRSVWT